MPGPQEPTSPTIKGETTGAEEEVASPRHRPANTPIVTPSPTREWLEPDDHPGREATPPRAEVDERPEDEPHTGARTPPASVEEVLDQISAGLNTVLDDREDTYPLFMARCPVHGPLGLAVSDIVATVRGVTPDDIVEAIMGQGYPGLRIVEIVTPDEMPSDFDALVGHAQTPRRPAAERYLTHDPNSRVDPFAFIGVGCVARSTWRVGDSAIEADVIVRGPFKGFVDMYVPRACLMAEVFNPASWRERAIAAEYQLSLGDFSFVDPHTTDLAHPGERCNLAITTALPLWQRIDDWTDTLLVSLHTPDARDPGAFARAECTQNQGRLVVDIARVLAEVLDTAHSVRNIPASVVVQPLPLEMDYEAERAVERFRADIDAPPPTPVAVDNVVHDNPALGGGGIPAPWRWQGQGPWSGSAEDQGLLLAGRTPPHGAGLPNSIT